MLREFSQRMIARTHEMEKEVDGLVHEAKVWSGKSQQSLVCLSVSRVCVLLVYLH